MAEVKGRVVLSGPQSAQVAFDIPPGCCGAGSLVVTYNAASFFYFGPGPPVLVTYHYLGADASLGGPMPAPTPGGDSYKYMTTLPMEPAFVRVTRRAANQTLLFGFAQAGYDPTFALGKFTLYVQDASPAYPKGWAFDLRDGRALCAVVDTDAGLRVCASHSLKQALKHDATKTVWDNPYTVAQQVNAAGVAIHPGRGRGQLWVTQATLSSDKTHFLHDTTTAQVCFSPTAGAQPDWTAPAVIKPPQIDASGAGQSAGAYAFETGANKRLVWMAGDGTTNIGQAVCTDDGQGLVWQTGGDSIQVGGRNSKGGAPVSQPDLAPQSAYGRVYSVVSPHPGKSHTVVVGGLTGLNGLYSPVVRAANGTVYQLVFSSQYSRLRPTTRRGAPAIPGAGGTTPASPAFINDPPNAFPQSLPYTVAVPDDINSVLAARFNWQQQYYSPRAPIAGRFDNPQKPAKVTFDVPPLLAVPGYDIHTGITYIASAYILLDFQYKNAKQARVHIGTKFIHNDPNAGGRDTGDPLGTNCTTYFEGSGEWGAQPLAWPALNQNGQIALSSPHTIDVDKARGGSLTLDVEVLGDVDAMQFKSCYLWYLYLKPGGGALAAESVTIASAQSDSVVPPLGFGDNGAVQPGPECWATGSYLFGQTALCDEISARHGRQWDFDLIYRPGTFANGTPQPYCQVFLDSYAQFTYQLEQPDFFLVRSIDGGSTWEFCNDAQPIAGLAALRDWNNTYNPVNLALMPALLTEGDVLYLCWAQSASGSAHPVQTLASQDFGKTWIAGPSKLTNPQLL